MNKKFSAMMTLILAALVAQAQDAPPDATWESDPLDVLETQQQQPVEPTVPEFTEISEPGAEVAPAPLQQVAPPPAPQNVSTPVKMPSLMGSEPDYSREAEFYRIYKNYNEQPTPVESWEKAVGGRESELYKVQKGDTLWGISTTFFGDPNFWPKVWSLNKGSILNPHEIDPAMNIQFFPGTADEAPTLELAAADTPENLVEGEKAVVVADQSTKASVPAPRKRTPLLEKLPKSLPAYHMGLIQDKKLELQVELPKNRFPIAPEALEYYMADAPIQGVGQVTAVEMGMKTAGDYQIIFVRLDQGGGKEFVVQKNLAQIADPRVKGRHGQMVEVQGEVEVLEKVNEQKNIYRAIVRRTLQPVEVGAVLTPGRLPMIDPLPSELTSGVGAKIIGGQFDKKRTLIGNNTLVFLDAGSAAGLQEGQSLAIFADERIRNKKNEAIMNDRVIGRLKIVRVAQNFATAYVMKSVDDILVGDYVGRMTTQASNTPAPTVDENFEKEFDEVPASQDSEGISPDGGLDDSDLDF